MVVKMEPLIRIWYTPIPHNGNTRLAFSFHRLYREIMAQRSKPHSHPHPEPETQALRARLRKIVGQLHGVERMLESERDCTELLTQLLSIRKALKSLSEKIIHSHLHHCIESATDEASAKRNMHELLTVLERYVE